MPGASNMAAKRWVITPKSSLFQTLIHDKEGINERKETLDRGVMYDKGGIPVKT